MQHQRAMRVDHAFRVPRGPGGVAHRRRLGFVQLRQSATARPRLEQPFVVFVRVRRRLACPVHEYAFERSLGDKFFQHRQKYFVHDHKPVRRVSHDEPKLLRRKPQIQRVQHAARQRNPEVRLQVHAVIPHQRGHALAAPQAGPDQRASQRPRPRRHLRIRAPLDAAVGPARNDLHPWIERHRALQYRPERQLKVHHGALHSHELPGLCPDSIQRPPPLQAAARTSERHFSLDTEEQFEEREKRRALKPKKRRGGIPAFANQTTAAGPRLTRLRSRSRPLRRALPTRRNRYLPPPPLRFGSGNGYLQNAILEVGLGVFHFRVLRQRYQPPEAPVASFRALISALFSAVLPLALAFDHQSIRRRLHLHVFLRQARQFRRNDEIIVVLPDLHRRRPSQFAPRGSGWSREVRERPVHLIRKPSH